MPTRFTTASDPATRARDAGGIGDVGRGELRLAEPAERLQEPRLARIALDHADARAAAQQRLRDITAEKAARRRTASPADPYPCVPFRACYRVSPCPSRAVVDKRRTPSPKAARLPRAQMAELVDAPASGAGDRKVVEVRVLFWAPFVLPERLAGIDKTAEFLPFLSLTGPGLCQAISDHPGPFGATVGAMMAPLKFDGTMAPAGFDETSFRISRGNWSCRSETFKSAAFVRRTSFIKCADERRPLPRGPSQRIEAVALQISLSSANRSGWRLVAIPRWASPMRAAGATTRGGARGGQSTR